MSYHGYRVTMVTELPWLQSNGFYRNPHNSLITFYETAPNLFNITNKLLLLFMFFMNNNF